MSIFDRLRSNSTNPLDEALPVEPPAVGSPEQVRPSIEHPGLRVTPFPGMAPAKTVFIQTADVVHDGSEATDQDIETLRGFWRFVHKRQPGLILQFKASL